MLIHRQADRYGTPITDCVASVFNQLAQQAHTVFQRTAVFVGTPVIAWREEMERQGYRKTDLTIGVVKANLLALIVMLPFAVLSGAVVLSSYSLRSMIKSPITSLVLLFLFLALLLLTAVHEGIHALTWAMFGKDYWKSIRFGVIWKALTPYCTCLRPVKRGQYILGAAMPTLVLGIGLTAAAALTGSFSVFILAIAMIFGGGGDFTIILKMLLHRQQGRDAVYYDHPYECGVVIFEKD